MTEPKPHSEKAILVGIAAEGTSQELTREHMDELAFLVETVGGEPGKRFIQRLHHPDPKTYVGSGKLNEIHEYLKITKADIAVFNDELSPSQIRNIEKVLPCRILDRNNLILDIFATRAKTATARTQVELAQCEYLLPRLTRRWTHLEKQRGGIGLRGPGEQEIETDRRYLRWRIKLLKKKLEEIDKQKATQRKSRRNQVRVALVGYTNVGKSTLMNVLSKSDLFAENKLFATLDTTVRKIVIHQTPFLLSDTVGFIRKLPHTLIESFKSTLDEVREADILVHVVDISHPDHEEQIEVVQQTLSEMEASNKPTLMVFNKIDAIPEENDQEFPGCEEISVLEELKKRWVGRNHQAAVFISATNKINLVQLRESLYAEVRRIQQQRWPENPNPSG